MSEKDKKPSELGADFSVRKRQAHRSVDVCLTAKRKAVLSVRKCMEMETESQHFLCVLEKVLGAVVRLSEACGFGKAEFVHLVAATSSSVNNVT